MSTNNPIVHLSLHVLPGRGKSMMIFTNNNNTTTYKIEV
jgi:hypothetical protein